MLMGMLGLAITPPVVAQNGGKPQAAPGYQRLPIEAVTGAASVVAGDLVTVGATKVRLYGIAAPETGQKCRNRYSHELECGKIAAEVLRTLVEGAVVSCAVDRKDRTGQKVGVCRVRGVDLGAAMVARGWAFAYRGLSPDYVGSEAYAESKRLGMWGGRVETPWQWRSRQQRERAK
ncbi:micrococcal nuclease [uncultured Gammaproteobacteria bacterium]